MRPVSTVTTNLAVALWQAADRVPDRAALVHGDVETSWREMRRRVMSAAAHLRERGVGHGDRVVVQSRNRLSMFESIYACWTLGAVWTPVNFRLMPDDVAFIARQSGATLLLAEDVFADHAAATGLPVVDLGDEWEELARSDAVVEPATVDRDDPAWFFYTSGTTGRPKAGVLTHGQLQFVVTNHAADLMPGLSDRTDCSLVVAPLSHGAGLHQMVQVARGVTSVLLAGARFDPAEVFALIERHRVTNAFTVPTILKMLAEHPAAAEHDHSSLRHVIYAGAPMTRADQVRALEALGPCLVQYYGMGEVSGNITVLRADEHSPDDAVHPIGSCGVPRTGIDISIRSSEGRERPTGEDGEVCVRGPAVFAGYHDNDAANAENFRDGWFRTGDLGHLDERGFLYLTGRASDMFISGGSNIYPLEIEEHVARHPHVADCAVFGMPDETWGEIGVAAIVPRDGFDEAVFLAWLRERVARYKVPRRIELFDALPTSGYGKVTKKLVREAVEARDSAA